jgi:hypothetical protein
LTIGYDPNNWITSDKFQPTIAGYYIVQASVWWDAGSVTNNQNNIQFRKNGTTQIVINQTQVLTGSGYAQELNTITYFNGTTDYIELTAFTGNTTSQGINGAASGTWLEIALITVGVGAQGQQGPTGPVGVGSQGPTGPAGSGGGAGGTGIALLPTSTLTDGATIPVSLTSSNSPVFRVTLAGNRTLQNPTNMPTGTDVKYFGVIVTQDDTGSRTLSYDTQYNTGDIDTDLNYTANSRTHLYFMASSGLIELIGKRT